ncbi:MAG: hypothetical protein RLZZ435_1246, partial [Cyanobacteriota bacterium]
NSNLLRQRREGSEFQLGWVWKLA